MVKMKKVKLDYRCISDHPQQSQSQLIVISTRKLFSIGYFSCLAVLLVLANHIHGINSQGKQSSPPYIFSYKITIWLQFNFEKNCICEKSGNSNLGQCSCLMLSLSSALGVECLQAFCNAGTKLFLTYLIVLLHSIPSFCFTPSRRRSNFIGNLGTFGII